MIYEAHIPAEAIVRYELPDDMTPAEVSEWETRARADLAQITALWEHLPEGVSVELVPPHLGATFRMRFPNGQPATDAVELRCEGAALLAELGVTR